MDKPMDWQTLRNRIALKLTSVACHLSAVPRRPVTVMGLEFPSPVGIAAGFDRNGALGRRVAPLGFGFNEIGSLTAAALVRLKPISPGEARLGVNLTLDAKCSIAETCALLRGAWQHADYLALNLIGPASAPLLHQGEQLHNLLSALREELHHLNQKGERRVPLIAKLRCLPEQIPFSLAELLLRLEFDGLLAAHDPRPPATRERYLAWQDPRRQAQACEQIEHLRRFCGKDIALLSVGGIQTASHLQARVRAGAELVQVHAALLRQGPWLGYMLLR